MTAELKSAFVSRHLAESMNRSPVLPIIGLLTFITHAASAASRNEEGSTVTSAILAALPILIFVVILYFFFRNQMNSPAVKQQQEYVENQIRHAQRMEELLERIAVALEKNGKGVL